MSKALFSDWWTRLVAVMFAAVSLLHGQEQGPNGHYYQVVLQPGVTWEDAKTAAEQSTFNGVHGYLATITSPEEDQLIENLRIQAAPGGYNAVWVGGSQTAGSTGPTAGWHWVNGEGPIATTLAEGGYSNWQPGEPNDYWGPNSENYLSVGHFNQFGWNDSGNDGQI